MPSYRPLRPYGLWARTASAESLSGARFYQALLDGGQRDGVRVPQSATIDQARRPSSDGELDRFLQSSVRWAQGFQLGGPSPDPTMGRAMGRLGSPLTFGHNGSNCCIVWADPTRRIAFAYLTNLLSPGYEGTRHQMDVADAVIGACS